MDGSAGETPNEDLRLELIALRSRIEAIERTLRDHAGVLPKNQPLQIDAPDQPLAAASAGLEGKPSALESRIGAQFFNRVGIFAVLAGAAWFLKLAIDREWVGPGVRVGIGLLTAAGLVTWSERFRAAGSRSFSYTLKALGAGIAYLSLWACFSLYHLAPAVFVFAAMAAVTLGNALLAWRQQSELLAALALAGGLATPALLSAGANQEVFLFSYLLLLDGGALALMATRRWPRLIIGAFVGTTVYLAVWWTQYYAMGDLMPTGVFLAAFFLLFSAAPFLELRQRLSGYLREPRHLLTGFSVAVGICSFVEAWRLLPDESSTLAWIALALGLTYFAFLFLARPADAGSLRFVEPLHAVHFSMAVGFVALASLLKFHGYGIPLCWLVELAVLAVVSVRARQLNGALRGSTSSLLQLSFGGLLLLSQYDHQPFGTTAFLNAHFVTYLAGLASFAVVIAVAKRGMASSSPNASFSLRDISPHSWVFLAGAATLAFNLVALLAVALQFELLWHQQLQIKAGLHSFLRPAYVDFTYSAWFLLYSAALMLAGFLRRSAFLRWQALILLMFSIGKIVLIDTVRLGEGYRVVCFLGLGILLLSVSFAYQRDWLVLRQPRD
jgi:uncharacterized membrane protein